MGRIRRFITSSSPGGPEEVRTMTRQKKEIVKKIDDLEKWIEVDVELPL